MGSRVGSTIAANLRRLRATRSMSAVELARRASISRATLSQLEAGGGNPTLETLYALANVLDASLADLLSDRVDEAPPRVLRAGAGVHVRGSAVQGWLLERIDGRVGFELYELRVEGHVAQVSDPHPDGTWERVYLYDGRLRVGAVTSPLDLQPGDYAVYPADEPHVYENLGEDPARGLLVIGRADL